MDERLFGHDNSGDDNAAGHGLGRGTGAGLGTSNGAGYGYGNSDGGDVGNGTNGSGIGGSTGFSCDDGTGFGQGHADGNGMGHGYGYSDDHVDLLSALALPLQYYRLFPQTNGGLLLADRFVNVTTSLEQESMLGILELRSDQ
jgi:hypothetical protein